MHKVSCNPLSRLRQVKKPRHLPVTLGLDPGSGYFQAAPAKLIDRLGTRVSFTLGVDGELGRQIAEPIGDVPAALAAI